MNNMKLTEEQWSKLNNESKGSHNSANLSDSDFPKQTLSDKYQEYKDWLNEIPEISDEEIEKAAIEYYESPVGNLDREIGFRYACKWYREQLKTK